MTNLDDTLSALATVDIDLAAIDVPALPAPTPHVDFQREVHALLGLPIDAIDTAGAVEAVRRAAFTNTPLMISTPNLNFLVTALSDPAFRASVTTSELNIVDGTPLVWVARLLGLPIRERVSGADVFEALAAHAEPPVTVFLFGGPDGVASAACQRLNATARGLRCVGYAAPGFCTVEQMSGEAYISRINACVPQFVVCALGAKKGQTWLQRNRTRLAAPVLCHLGAVVNFAAGTVRRAPRLLQRLGFEWLWRILEEPALWRRYASDSVVFLGLLFTSVLPLMIETRWKRPPDEAWRQATLARETAGDAATLTLAGAWGQRNLQPLRDALAALVGPTRRLRVVMRDVSHVDSAFIGLLMLAPRAFPLGVELVEPQPGVVRTLRRYRAADLLAPSGGPHA
jgi:N-acetylglucosaminyldiphosphoundecaprenol N-acetyl-beta-D-mannosaminyltransferase